MAKCARTACNNEGTQPHKDLPGLYCIPCGRKINDYSGPLVEMPTDKRVYLERFDGDDSSDATSGCIVSYDSVEAAMLEIVGPKPTWERTDIWDLKLQEHGFYYDGSTYGSGRAWFHSDLKDYECRLKKFVAVMSGEERSFIESYESTDWYRPISAEKVERRAQALLTTARLMREGKPLP